MIALRSVWVEREASPLQIGMRGHRRWGKLDSWKQVAIADVVPRGASGTDPDLPSSFDDSLNQDGVRMIRPFDFSGVPGGGDNIEDSLPVHHDCHRDLIWPCPCRFHDLSKSFSSSQGSVDLTATSFRSVKGVFPGCVNRKLHPNRQFHDRTLSLVDEHQQMTANPT